jgi:hypothetical protein
LLLTGINFAPQMKKLIAIFFICLLGLHFAPAFSSLSQQSVICMDIEEEKNSDKSKDSLKEKLEKKDFEYNRLSCFTLLTLQIIDNAAANFSLQQPVTDILTPPPNHC